MHTSGHRVSGQRPDASSAASARGDAAATTTTTATATATTNTSTNGSLVGTTGASRAHHLCMPSYTVPPHGHEAREEEREDDEAEPLGNTALSIEPLEESSGDYPSPRKNTMDALDLDTLAVVESGPAFDEASPSRRGPAKLLYAMTDSVRIMRRRIHQMSWKQLAWVFFLVVLVMAGNAMQILMLNFWLDSFPEGTEGNYTAFAFPGIVFSLFFVVSLVVYIAVKRPGLRFARHRYGWSLLVGIGFCDTFNSWTATYAASHTSEVLQALFTNLGPLYAVFMSKWILHDPRKYFNGWIIAVFVLTIAGILVVSLYGFITSSGMATGKMWILVFFCSIPFRALMNVWQSLYMIVYTRDPAFTEWLWRRFSAAGAGGPHAAGGECAKQHAVADASVSTSGAAGESAQTESFSHCEALEEALHSGEDSSLRSARMIIAPPPSACASGLPSLHVSRAVSRNASFAASAWDPLAGVPPARSTSAGSGATAPRPASTEPQAVPGQEIVAVRFHQGEDMIVKLVMLAGETVAQTCFTLSLLPADALPWWGNSATVQETWHNFTQGIVCLFTMRNNFIFGFLNIVGFVFTYVGCAYLNHYSVALCSIVSQLSSPLTALLLVLVPKWNVQDGGDSPWYCSVLAIILLSIAAFVYVVWEEMTDAEKVEGERVLKMKKLRVRPLEPDPTVPQDASAM